MKNINVSEFVQLGKNTQRICFIVEKMSEGVFSFSFRGMNHNLYITCDYNYVITSKTFLYPTSDFRFQENYEKLWKR